MATKHAREPDREFKSAPSAIETLPALAKERGIEQQLWDVFTNSLYPGAAVESIVAVHSYCKARGLDPFKRPVHIVPMEVTDSKTGRKQWRDVIMPGIGELRVTAMRTGEYFGIDEPVHGEEITHLGIKAPAWSRVTVYRRIHGERVAFTHTERFVEAVATKKGGSQPTWIWKRRPVGQLDKCAEAGALRKAFPDELGDTYSAEEMHGKVIEGEVLERTETMPPAEAEPQYPESRTATVGAKVKAAAAAVAGEPEAELEPEPAPASSTGPSLAEIESMIAEAKTADDLDTALSFVNDIQGDGAFRHKKRLNELLVVRRREIAG